MRMSSFVSSVLLASAVAATKAQISLDSWQMQDAANVAVTAENLSMNSFHPEGWYKATIPATVLTTLVENHIYPEPLYGENMRDIPESLNKNSYWYRTNFAVPATYKGRHVWLNFGGINYSAEIWLNGHHCGSMRGAFIRGNFDITEYAPPGKEATLAVLVSPQPHPGVPHEHTAALGNGRNGGETSIDGPTFLSTIGWDWMPAIRDRDTGIWQPVTLSSSGPVQIHDSFVSAQLSTDLSTADLNIQVTVKNESAKKISGELVGTISGQGKDIEFRHAVSLDGDAAQPLELTSAEIPGLHVIEPRLWWPNGYGLQNLYQLNLHFEANHVISDSETIQFGIRKIEYEVPDSDKLTISVNGVRIMVRGGDWGMDEGLKRVPRERLDAQFHMHALANLNMIRNWVGQSTSPDFYDLADKYGLLLWDEFFQPNPNDGPDPTDIPTYLANVTDKVVRYRNHPAIAVWCARNEGYPPKALDEALRTLMARLDPQRLYQSNSADGRGVSSHGPYYWRAPRFYYAFSESFKTETGSVSIPTLESIQGMMPEKDWETINDDWAQHDMSSGAQRGNEFPSTLAKRYGPIRNLADFSRKGAMATYEGFRAMYEGRNATMFENTTGILTWMSHPAQPSFVWQLYHYDLEPNAALYATKKAAESVHIQLNEANFGVEAVNNKPQELSNFKAEVTIYDSKSIVNSKKVFDVNAVPASKTIKIAQLEVSSRISPIYFVKLDLFDRNHSLVSTNLYWQNVSAEDFTHLADIPRARIKATALRRVVGESTRIDVILNNQTTSIALLAHLQLHRKKDGKRVLPVFYSDNYISLVPGESRGVSIQFATKDLGGQLPMILVDGYNVDVEAVEGDVSIAPNLNALPSHWPATGIVPN